MNRLVILAACMSLIVLPAAAQEAPPDAVKGTASISGRVTAAETGRPVTTAVLELLSWDVMRLPKRARPDEQGRFQFADLVPGRYQLTAFADGFIRIEFGQARPPEPGTPIDLKDGDRFDKADIVLRRPGAIEGRVTDEFGDPAPGILVGAVQLQFAAGRKRFMPAVVTGTTRLTDDRGHFRIFGLEPGDYYLVATAGAFGYVGNTREQSEVGGLVPTYYPGTTDAAAATPVRIGLGRDFIDATFALTPGRTGRVEGQVTNRQQAPVSGGTVSLIVSDRVRSPAFLYARVASGKDGSFVFRDVPPGVYTIQAYGRSVSGAGNLGAAEFGWLPVITDGSDVRGLIVPVGAGPAVRGRITFDDSKAPMPAPRDIHVMTRPIEFDSAPIGGGPSPSITRPDWTFEVSNQSGIRVVTADIASPTWSVWQIKRGDEDITDKPIDFGKGDLDEVEILLTTHNPTVGGNVVDADGRPTGRYTVVVFAADPSKWTFPSRYVMLGRPNQDGRFKVSGLPPAEYLLLALARLSGSEWQDPEFLEMMRPLATPVRLAEGDAKMVDLKIAPRPR